jgi:5-methylcytosine-specific restriction endonuclease McrA
MSKMGGRQRASRRKKLFEIWGVNDHAPCWWCLVMLPNTPRATIEHLIPQSMGGGHHIENLRIACDECNSGHVNPLDVLHLVHHKIEVICA